MKYIIESYEVFNNSKGGKFWGDRAAGILPIARDSKRILLNLRSEYVNEPNQYGVYGGKVDGDETDLSLVAKREFKEESEYSGEIEMIPAYLFKTADGAFSYQNFIGIIATEFEPEYDWESQGHLWVTFDELMDMINNKPNLMHFGLKALVKNSLGIIKTATSS